MKTKLASTRRALEKISLTFRHQDPHQSRTRGGRRRPETGVLFKCSKVVTTRVCCNKSMLQVS
eukprot:609536-Pelagomonas_calceolata.AAC.2